MGYYSTVSWNLDKAVVDKEKIEEIESYFQNYENENVAGFAGVKLPVDENGLLKDIELEDYHGKFYDDRYFTEKLKEAIKEGVVQLSFVGEDGDTWGYKITPGGVVEMEGILMSVNMRPTYCKNCSTLVGYIDRRIVKKIDITCDACSERRI